MHQIWTYQYKIALQVVDVLNESGSFGGVNVAPAVENCFSMVCL